MLRRVVSGAFGIGEGWSVTGRCGHENGPPAFRAGRPVIVERALSGALGLAAVPAVELLHPPGRVEDARLPGVERVADR
jgi:hypothetical protein